MTNADKLKYDEVALLEIKTKAKELKTMIAQVAGLHLKTILELKNIYGLISPICEENERRMIDAALSELEGKVHTIHSRWSE